MFEDLRKWSVQFLSVPVYIGVALNQSVWLVGWLRHLTIAPASTTHLADGREGAFLPSSLRRLFSIQWLGTSFAIVFLDQVLPPWRGQGSGGSGHER